MLLIYRCENLRMAKLTALEFERAVARELAKESDSPEQWMYLSFAGKTFNGAVFLRAKGMAHAMQALADLGIKNPGGEVIGVAIPEEEENNLPPTTPESYRNRLLNKADILEIWPESKSIREWEAESA